MVIRQNSMSNRSAHRATPRTPAQAKPRELRLNVTSDPANLATVRRACEAFCRDCGLSEAAAGEVGLVVNEAMANITRHAYGGAADRPIDILCEELPAEQGGGGGGGVRVAIRDWGSGVNPASLPGRDPSPETPGGLGLVCLRRLMDEANYLPQPDGMVLVMVKRERV